MYTQLGMKSYPGGQVINLGTGCMSQRLIQHELAHALGMWHEQSRPDRDNYVTILWDNIRTESSYNYRKIDKHYVDYQGTSYDMSNLG